MRHVPVTDVIKSYFGLTAFMDLDALDELMYGPRLTGVHIAYDARQQGDLFTAIKSTPGIGSIALQRHALARFRETIAQNINYSVTIYVTLAVIIAFGVVYNSARIQLSEHARELASLRVLGFTRAEVSRVLLTELALLTARCHSAGLGHRLRLRLAADPGLLQRPLSRAVHHRAGDLCQGQPGRAAGHRGLGAHRAPARRQARPDCRAEDQRLGATHAIVLAVQLSSAGSSPRALAVLVGALAWAMWPKPVAVELAELRKGPLVVTVDEEGKTRIKDVYTVSAPITGKLVRLSLEAGDRVKKDVTTVASHRADGAALPRRAHHARARGADRGRQGGRRAGRGGDQPGRRRARVRRERAHARGRPDRAPRRSPSAPWSGRGSTSIRGAPRWPGPSPASRCASASWKARRRD